MSWAKLDTELGLLVATAQMRGTSFSPSISRGKSWLRLTELRDYVTTFRDTATAPSLIIIHAGTNDIGYLQKKEPLAEIANAIYYMHGVNAEVRVTWSDILPRVKNHNFPLDKQNIPERVRRAANKYARSVTRRINGASVTHPQVTHQSEDFPGRGPSSGQGDHHSYE